MTIRASILHFYRQARKHQINTYGPGGLFIDGVDQRQHTGGGAAYGLHALAAYNSAKRTVHFRKTHSAK